MGVNFLVTILLRFHPLAGNCLAKERDTVENRWPSGFETFPSPRGELFSQRVTFIEAPGGYTQGFHPLAGNCLAKADTYMETWSSRSPRVVSIPSRGIV